MGKYISLKIKVKGQVNRAINVFFFHGSSLSCLLTDGERKLKDTTEENNLGCFQSVCDFILMCLVKVKHVL